MLLSPPPPSMTVVKYTLSSIAFTYLHKNKEKCRVKISLPNYRGGYTKMYSMIDFYANFLKFISQPNVYTVYGIAYWWLIGGHINNVLWVVFYLSKFKRNV